MLHFGLRDLNSGSAHATDPAALEKPIGKKRNSMIMQILKGQSETDVKLKVAEKKRKEALDRKRQDKKDIHYDGPPLVSCLHVIVFSPNFIDNVCFWPPSVVIRLLAHRVPFHQYKKGKSAGAAPAPFSGTMRNASTSPLTSPSERNKIGIRACGSDSPEYYQVRFGEERGH